MTRFLLPIPIICIPWSLYFYDLCTIKPHRTTASCVLAVGLSNLFPITVLGIAGLVTWRLRK